MDQNSVDPKKKADRALVGKHWEKYYRIFIPKLNKVLGLLSVFRIAK